MSRCAIFLLCIALPLAGCSSTGGESSGDFYTPPDPLPSSLPGTLIRSQEIEPFADGTQAWRVLYVSQAVEGTPIAVSGMVAAPGRPVPEAGYEVVTWAHGTTGLSDPCAPSRGYRPSEFSDVAVAALAANYVIVGSDYEGVGTPGIHPYLVGSSEGRSVLDIVKAAQQIEEAGVGNRVVVWGISQGGHAALFAAEIAASWAPMLDVLGVVAAAPGSELQTMVQAGSLLSNTRFFLWEVALGFDAAYEELSIQDVFSPETQDAIQGLLENEACQDGFQEVADGIQGPVFSTSPLDLDDWPERLLENSPGHVRTEAPILLLQSEDDTDVPILLTNAYNDRACDIGNEVEYRVFEGVPHGETFVHDLAGIVQWTEARFADELATSTCE